MSGPRFIEVPAADIERALAEVAAACETRGCRSEWTVRGNERVFELDVPTKCGVGRGVVRIFTSLSVGAETVRDVGDDAVRIVVLARREDETLGTTEYPVGPARRIYRTAPTHLPTEQRIAAFLERLREVMRGAYAVAREVTPFRRFGTTHVASQGAKFVTQARLLFEPRKVSSGRYLTKLATQEGGLIVWFAPQKIENADHEILKIEGRVLRHETTPGGLHETVAVLFTQRA